MQNNYWGEIGLYATIDSGDDDSHMFVEIGCNRSFRITRRSDAKIMYAEHSIGSYTRHISRFVGGMSAIQENHKNLQILMICMYIYCFIDMNNIQRPQSKHCVAFAFSNFGRSVQLCFGRALVYVPTNASRLTKVEPHTLCFSVFMRTTKARNAPHDKCRLSKQFNATHRLG